LADTIEIKVKQGEVTDAIKNLKDIQDLITTISKTPVTLNVQTFVNAINNLGQAANKAGQSASTLGNNVIKVTQTFKGAKGTAGTLVKEVETLQRAVGVTEERISVLNKDTQELDLTTTRLTTDVEKQAKAFEKAAAATEKQERETVNADKKAASLSSSFDSLITTIQKLEKSYPEQTFTALSGRIKDASDRLGELVVAYVSGEISQKEFTSELQRTDLALAEYNAELSAIKRAAGDAPEQMKAATKSAEEQAKAFDTAQAAVTRLETSYSKLISAINVKEGKYAEGTFTALKAEVQATREELGNYDRQLQNGTMSQELYTAKVDEAKQKLQEYESQLAAILADDSKLATTGTGLAASVQTAHDVAVKLSGSFAELDGKIGNLQSKYPEGTFDGISTAIAAARSDLERLNAEFASGQITDVQYTDGIASLSRTYDALSASIKVTKNEVEQLQPPLEETTSLVDRLGTAFSNLITRLGRRYLISTFRETVDTMQAVDDELVNISKITGQTVEELGSLEDAAYRVAAALGVSADEHLSNTAAFYRAGYREQADELALLADKIEIISGMTAEQAQQFIISADAAYGYKGNVEALTNVMDGAISIDNKYATTVQKIAEGIGIVAPVASQVHVSIEELTAALGTITAVTQRTGSESARALRALFLNIVGDTKTEIDEGVTWTTGEIAGLQDVIHKYAADVVEAAEATGSVINPMEAIHALNQAMKDGLLSEAELMETVSDIGGKLRSSQLLAIVQNWDMYESMLSEFETSAGNTEAKVEAAMDSWSVKSQQLQNAWTEFVSNLVDTGAIKDDLDGVIKLVELLNTDFGRTVVVFTTVATAGIGLVGVIGNIVGAIRNAIVILGASNPVVLGVTAAVAALAAGIRYAKQKQEEFENSVNEIAPKLSGLKSTLESTTEAINSANEAYEKSKEETDSTASKAQHLVEELKKLESQTDKTTSGFKRKKAIVEELNGLIPGLNLTIDSTTGKLNTETTAIYNQITAWQQLAQVEAAQEQYKELYKQKLTLEQKASEARENFIASGNAYHEANTAWKSFSDQVLGSNESTWYLGKDLANNAKAANAAYTQSGEVYSGYLSQIKAIDGQIAYLDKFITDNEQRGDSSIDGPIALTVSGKTGSLPAHTGGSRNDDDDDDDTTTSTGTVKTANELMLETIQATKAVEEARLQYLEASGASAEELVEQYKLLQSITHDEAEKLRDIEESQNGVRGETADTLKLSTEWWKYQDEINELLEKAEETVEEIAEEEYDLKSALEETVALLKEVNGAALDEQTTAIDEQISAIDAQIDAINEKNKAEKETNALEEKRLALLEAEEKLRNVQNERNVRIFNASTGQWEHVANQNDVTSAQQAVDEARQALIEAQSEAQDNAAIAALEAKKDALEAEKSALKAQYEEQESAWDALLKGLEEPTKSLAAAFKDLAENGTPEVVRALLNVASSFGISESDIAETLKKFGLESVEGDLGNALANAGIDVKQFAQELVKTSILNRMMRRSDAWFDASDEDRAELESLNEADAAVLGLTKGKNGGWYWSDGSLAYQTDTQKAHVTSSGGSTNGSTSSGSSTSVSTGSKTVSVQADGNAPPGLNPGDLVVTKGGTYRILGGSYGNYQSERVYDSGGILRGTGGIKATSEDEMVLPPNVTKALLKPQNSSAFSQRLSELGFLYGVNGYNNITPGSSTTMRSSNDHYGDTYQYGNITLTEGQAKGTSVYELARLSRGLAIHS